MLAHFPMYKLIFWQTTWFFQVEKSFAAEDVLKEEPNTDYITFTNKH